MFINTSEVAVKITVVSVCTIVMPIVPGPVTAHAYTLAWPCYSVKCTDMCGSAAYLAGYFVRDANAGIISVWSVACSTLR